MARPASARAATTTTMASTTMRCLSLLGMALSRIERMANGGTSPMRAEMKIDSMNTAMVPR